jgi:hypothetical protein
MDTKTKKQFRLAGIPVAALALSVPAMVLSASGCTDDLCCSDFQPGTDMTQIDWGIEGKGNIEFGLALQAIGDFSAAATAITTDLGVACRGIAVDLGEPETSVTATDPNEATKAWCSVAVTAIGKLKAQAQLSIKVQPAKCTIDVSVQGGCEGSCQADASCDPGSIEARCTGGEISGKCDAACSGKCEGSASVAVDCNAACEGTCTGTCSGTCEGKCDGVATPAGGMANCMGTCEGTCSASCQGSCRGSCDVSAMGGASCNGECRGSCSVEMKAPKCTAEIDPPSCEASAECKASCKASASAKAECTPPSVAIEASGSADIQGKIAVLEKWLPQIFLIAEARAKLLFDNAEAMIQVAGNLDASLEGDGKAVFCIIPALAAIEQAGVNIEASLSASISVVGSVKPGG